MVASIAGLKLEGHITVSMPGGEPVSIASFDLPINISSELTTTDDPPRLMLHADTDNLKADVGRALLDVADRLLAP